MVAAHIYDLRAAAKVGMKTVYVERPGEAPGDITVKPKAEGGEVDCVVQSVCRACFFVQSDALNATMPLGDIV